MNVTNKTQDYAAMYPTDQALAIQPNAENIAAYANAVGAGPIPPGTYYIVDRQSGGTLGWFYDFAHDVFTNNSKSQWFALYSTDTNSDIVNVDGVTRDGLRLHPVRPNGTGDSDGCITLCSFNDFTNLRQQLLNTSTFLIPGTNIKAYGTINVYVPTLPTSVKGHQ